VKGYFPLLYHWIRIEVFSIPGRMIALVFIASLALIPLITQQPHILRILIIAAIFAIYAASWDFLAGYTGQISFGHSLFFGGAAYMAALLNIHLKLPPSVTIPLSGIGSMILGLVAAIPALRLRGFYLALVTLSFPVILTGIIFIFPDLTGGELGLFGLARLSSARILENYIVFVVMLISILIMYKLTDTGSKIIRFGIVLQAIREDEITARRSGINTVRYKLLAFAISGFFAGIAGGLYAHFLKIVGPSTLEVFFAFQPVLWTIFGGIGTIYGGVTGVYILYPMMELVRLHPIGDQIRGVMVALILIFTLLFMPEGITVWVRDKIEIRCQRCKIINISIRRHCRACQAPLHLEEKRTFDGGG